MLQGLISAARDRNIRLRIVNSYKDVPSNDTVDLINAGTLRKVLFVAYNGGVMAFSHR